MFSSPELCSRWVIVIAFCPASGVRCLSNVVRCPSCVVRQLLLLSNQWVNWDETSQKASSQWPHQISFKFVRSMQNSGFHGNEMKKKIFWLADFQITLFLGWPSIRFLQDCWLVEKHGRDGGRGYFALYGYSENLKSSPPKLSGWFSNNFVEMFLKWPTIRFLQAMLIGWKTWPPVGRAILPYMVKVKT